MPNNSDTPKQNGIIRQVIKDEEALSTPLRRLSSSVVPTTPDLLKYYNGGFNRPSRLTSLHQVTMPQTPDSSPISPSIVHLTSSTHSISSAGSGLGNRALANRRSFCRSRSIGSPTSVYYGPSSSVSSLGFESRQTTVNDDSSSSEDGYESDRASSISSRRPSTSMLPEDSAIASGLGLSKMSFTKNEPKAAIRHFYSNAKALKPKAKNFLRVSKELQDEMSPLDYEIKKEAEVTSALRIDDDPKSRRNSFHGFSSFLNKNDRTIFPASSSIDPIIVNGEPRDNDPSDTDDSDIFPPLGSPALPKPEPNMLKRKVMEDSMEPSILKRRAVSPGLSSPILQASNGSSVMGSKRANIKQMQDTSDGFQNMSLKK